MREKGWEERGPKALGLWAGWGKCQFCLYGREDFSDVDGPEVGLRNFTLLWSEIAP